MSPPLISAHVSPPLPLHQHWREAGQELGQAKNWSGKINTATHQQSQPVEGAGWLSRKLEPYQFFLQISQVKQWPHDMGDNARGRGKAEGRSRNLSHRAKEQLSAAAQQPTGADKRHPLSSSSCSCHCTLQLHFEPALPEKEMTLPSPSPGHCCCPQNPHPSCHCRS